MKGRGQSNDGSTVCQEEIFTILIGHRQQSSKFMHICRMQWRLGMAHRWLHVGSKLPHTFRNVSGFLSAGPSYEQANRSVLPLSVTPAGCNLT